MKLTNRGIAVLLILAFVAGWAIRSILEPFIQYAYL